MKKIFDIFRLKRNCRPLQELQDGSSAKYRLFKGLLRHNRTALSLIADLEQMYHSGRPFSLVAARIKYEELFEAVLGIIHAVNAMSNGRYSALDTVCEALDKGLFEEFNPRCTLAPKYMVLPFEEVTADMEPFVGAKAAHLATIRNSIGLPAPPGFAVTSQAFATFIEENRLSKPLHDELSTLSVDAPDEIDKAGARIRAMILAAPVPAPVADEIRAAYAALEAKTAPGVRIAMRSSAVGEDTEASFAGQYATVLNVTAETLIEAYKAVIVSKYSGRALSYRLHHGIDDRSTPMCVAGVKMVDARASGVMYTVESSLSSFCPVQINALWGLGEHLVSGSASADMFLLDRRHRTICGRQISKKEQRLVALPSGGTRLEEVPENEQELPSLDDLTVHKLCEYGLLLEEFYGAPQDVEWALDNEGVLSILQSRPLSAPEVRTQREAVSVDPAEHPVLLSGGRTAAGGVAAGRVVRVSREEDLAGLPADAILVTKTASPHYAKAMGRIKGIITDIGSPTSHLASVAREFGVPAVFDTKNATRVLADGGVVTLSADDATVYRGVVEELLREGRPAKKTIFGSPVHRRLKGILDKISPLTLTDVASPAFSPEGCRTFHDIIRFTHEYAMKEMFGITEELKDKTTTLKLATKLPLHLQLIDFGGGLRGGLTSCDSLTPAHIESVPMRALWRGFVHPGITWEGTMSIDAGSIAGRLAASATAEFGETPGGDSYAILSHDYLNLSARFAYHFATVDALCGDDSDQNYITLQFAGGAGAYYGRSLRVQFIGAVLERLGFQVTVKGDLVDAAFSRYDRASVEDRLDRLGRLLASSRLLDMTLSGQDDVERYVAAFFDDDYDYLLKPRGDQLQGFYTGGGQWQRIVENSHVSCLQDGARWGRRLASSVAGIMGKVMGQSYQEFLDTVEAYYYFPLAVLRRHEFAEGMLSVRIKPVGGTIDQAGGIAFGIRDVENYFVLRSNALEDNIILFEFANGKRVKRAEASRKVETGLWHRLAVKVRDTQILAFFNGEPVLDYAAHEPPKGSIGLWTKADSVTAFDELTVTTDEGGERRIEF